MKSVTIRNPQGQLLFKALHRKNGTIEITRIANWKDVIIDVRDDYGCKVWLEGAKERMVVI